MFTGRQARRSTSAAVQGSVRSPPRNDTDSTIDAVDHAEPTTPDVMNTSFVQNDYALLPPLFNDNVDAFQFDDIFLGDTETDLDSFFADIFSLPTFPRLGVDVPTSALTSTSQPLVHEYRSDAEV